MKPDYEPRPEFRRRYTGRYELGDKVPGTETTIGEALLEPTLIYRRPLAAIADKMYNDHLTGFVGVHITGYGIKNINRVGEGVEYWIDNPLKQHPIFDLVQQEARYSEEDMERRFNRGMGFAVIINKFFADFVIRKASEYGFEAKYVGEVRTSNDPVPRVVVSRRGKEISFRGYP